MAHSNIPFKSWSLLCCCNNHHCFDISLSLGIWLSHILVKYGFAHLAIRVFMRSGTDLNFCNLLCTQGHYHAGKLSQKSDY